MTAADVTGVWMPAHDDAARRAVTTAILAGGLAGRPRGGAL